MSSFLVIALSACTGPTNQYDYPEKQLPTVEVSSTTARVGEPVRVTETQVIRFLEESRRPVHTYEKLELGACIVNAEPRVQFGMCNYPDDATGPVTLLDGTSYKKAFTDVTVERGDTITLTHTYVLTATEPVSFELGAVLWDYNPDRTPNTPPYSLIGESARLTFE